MSSMMGSNGSGFDRKLLEEESNQARLAGKKRKPEPLTFSDLMPSYNKILKIVSKAFKENTIQELDNQISVWRMSKAQIENFLTDNNNENAKMLCYQAIRHTPDTKALVFLEKHMSKELLGEVIRSEDFIALGTLISAMSRKEEEGTLGENDIKNLREKFKFLLRIEPGVSQYIKKPEIWNELRDGVRGAFNQAMIVAKSRR